jgi:hypothetical protein
VYLRHGIVVIASVKSGEIEMRSKVFLVFLVLFLLAIDENTWANEIYKWVDEKGTVHLSDTPPPAVLKNQDKGQPKNQDLNKDKTDDKNQVKNQDKNKVKKQDGDSDKLTTKEDALAILKRLEVGNRTIPEDMRKYGPAGPAGYERPPDAGGQTPSPPSVRRSIS